MEPDMIYTTLNRIRENAPSADVWRKLLAHLGKTAADDEPLAYDVIMKAVGLDGALWCLRAEPQHASIWRMYAVRVARSVQHLMGDARSIQALDVAERHARGAATDAELAAARAAASGVVGPVVWAAAWDVTRPKSWIAARSAAMDAATATASHAGAAADWDAARTKMTADFRALLASHDALPGESCAPNEWGGVRIVPEAGRGGG